MNININAQGRDLQNDNTYGVGSQISMPRMAAKTSEHSLGISGGDKDISGFRTEELTSFDDVRKKAASRDISLEATALAVMSNSMSGEDLARLTDDGFSAEDMTPQETVTSLDKIKATLVQSGVYIPGYTDDLPREVIEKIAGNAGNAAAIESALRDNQLPVSEDNVKSIEEVIELAKQVPTVSDDARKYMVNNSMEPTVENFYMAQHSSSEADNSGRAVYYRDATGYVGKNSQNIDFEELRPQVENIIRQSGLMVNEETLADAKWLITKDIPLNKESMEALHDIESISFPISAKVISDSCAAAIADGIPADKANLTNTESLVTKAVKLINETTLELDKMEASEIASKRMLEEVRLHMTVEANLTLLRKGITIDTSDLNNLVEQLKQAEREAFEPLLMKEKSADISDEARPVYERELDYRIDLFRRSQAAVNEITYGPIDFVADIANNTEADSTYTLRAAADKVASIRHDYAMASEAYETLMTAPRADMGDSIRKAFRNVDDILEDMNLELTRLNEKAVRTLGYAGMEITEENIDKAARATVAVENLITGMTPGRVLKMIRDGENPLDKDIYELSEELISSDDERDDQKYSEFLYKLDRAGSITEDEKTAFIGIYRLLRKVEKSDGKLTGDVLKSDEMLTLSNLLASSRSDRHIGTDVKIDDSFGALEQLITHGESITDQILAGFRSDKSINEQYDKERSLDISEALSKEQAVLDALEHFSEPASPVNMAAMDMIINSRGNLFRQLTDNTESDEEREDLESDFTELADSFSDEESVKKAYASLNEKAEKVIKNAKENADKYIDVKSMKLVHKQLSIISKMADRGTYEVPVMINGELTSINLKLINDSENAGKVNVSFETEHTGRVSAEFTLRNGDVSGFIVTENSYYTDVLKENEENLRKEFKSTSLNFSNVYYTNSKGVSVKGNYTDNTENKVPATKQLYEVAKAVIRSFH